MNRRKFVKNLGSGAVGGMWLASRNEASAGGTADSLAAQRSVITLDTIQFSGNHNWSTLSIRKNEKDVFEHPEWRQDSNGQITTSPVMMTASRQEINLLPRFRRTDGRWYEHLKVRAIAGEGDAGGIGDLGEQEIFFIFDGSSLNSIFSVDVARVRQVGVGVFNIRWRWQYSPNGNEWTDFAASEHQIYVTLDQPTLPWRHAEATNPHAPWAEALDIACRWAQGATTLDQAAEMVTRKVFALGREPNPWRVGEKFLTYNPVANYVDPHYYNRRTNELTVERFYLTSFLQRLREGTGLGQTVNCVDCATIVSTFANLLGCDLDQVIFSNPEQTLETNYICSIGSDSNTWHRREVADGSVWPLHSVAWQGPLEAGGIVYDGCLAVDGDGDAGSAPHQEVLPVKMRFGGPDDQESYFYRLVAPQSRSSAQFGERRRLPLVKPVLVSRDEVDFARRKLRSLAVQHRLHNLGQANTLGTNLFILRFQFSPSALPGWRLTYATSSDERGWSRANESFWHSVAGDMGTSLELAVFECSGRAVAQEFLVQMLPTIHARVVKREGIGDICYGDNPGTFVLFARGKEVLKRLCKWR